MLGVLYLEVLVSKRKKCNIEECLISAFFLLKVLYQSAIINNPMSSEFLMRQQDLSSMQMVYHMSLFKVCAPDFFPFVIYALYLVYHDNKKQTRKDLEKALAYERVYDTPQTVQH